MSRLRRITSKAQEFDIETTPRNWDYSSSFADVHLQPLKRELELETMLLSQSPATSASHASIGACHIRRSTSVCWSWRWEARKWILSKPWSHCCVPRQLFPIASPLFGPTQGSATNCGSPASETSTKYNRIVMLWCDDPNNPCPEWQHRDAPTNSPTQTGTLPQRQDDPKTRDMTDMFLMFQPASLCPI